MIANRTRPATRHALKQRAHLVTLQERDLGTPRALAGDRGDSLTGIEELRAPRGDVVEEHVERGEPLVACLRTITARAFDVVQELEEALEREVLERQTGHLRAPILRHEDGECQSSCRLLSITYECARASAPAMVS